MQINIEFYASLMQYLPPGKSRHRREVRVADGQRLAVLEEKAVFGEMALIDAEPRSATVTAFRDAVVIRVDRPAYDAMAAAHPGSN